MTPEEQAEALAARWTPVVFVVLGLLAALVLDVR